VPDEFYGDVEITPDSMTTAELPVFKCQTTKLEFVIDIFKKNCGYNYTECTTSSGLVVRFVTVVHPNTPASRSELLIGDIIVSVRSRPDNILYQQIEVVSNNPFRLAVKSKLVDEELSKVNAVS